MSETDDYSAPYDIAKREVNPWPAQPLPVVNATEEAAPEFGSTMTWAIPVLGTNPCIPILQRRVRRHKAYVEVNFTAPGTVYFNSNQDHCNQGQGYAVTVPVTGLYRLGDWETQQPLYIIASVSGLVCSVIDMSYGSR